MVVVAANAKGEIVRYFEAGESAPYFGSPFARDAKTGRYDAAREARHIASTGKIVAAIAIANEGRDQPGTLYADPNAPGAMVDTCEKGSGDTPGQRRAVVAFACSLNAPLIARTATIGQERVKQIIDGFGFAMPPVRRQRRTHTAVDRGGARPDRAARRAACITWQPSCTAALTGNGQQTGACANVWCAPTTTLRLNAAGLANPADETDHAEQADSHRSARDAEITAVRRHSAIVRAAAAQAR